MPDAAASTVSSLGEPSANNSNNNNNNDYPALQALVGQLQTKVEHGEQARKQLEVGCMR